MAGFRAALPDLQRGRRHRLAVLRARLRGRRALRRPRGARRRTRRARRARTRARPRLRPQPRRARPPVAGGAARLLRHRHRGRPRARSGSLSPHARRDRRARPRSVLPALARRRAAQRVLRHAARRGRRAADRRRRAVRRPALRHGDADDQRGVRAHVGRPRRRTARGGVLAVRDRTRQGRPPGADVLSPRPTGTWSGRSSSTASTTATTSASTTGSCTKAPTRSAATCSRDATYQERLLRFIENHDEPRAAATFGGAQARAAAVVASTLQGARLVPRRPARRPPRAHPGLPRPRPRRAA